jgi:hypothetical protein
MTKKATIEPRTEPAPEGHGFVSIVSSDGEDVFNSLSHHGKLHGIFKEETAASSHASAWASALRRYGDERKSLKAARAGLLAGKIIVLNGQASNERIKEDKYKKAAKTARENAEACQSLIGELARDADDPHMRIEWPDHNKPSAVKVVSEPSVWDAADFVPAAPRDVAQISIPGVDWSVGKDEDEVRRVVGYGKAILSIEDGEIKIVFGNDEHIIVVRGSWELEYTQPEPEKTEPTAEEKKAKPTIEAKSGGLGLKELRARLDYLTRPETLFGIYILESQRKKPRARVLNSLSERAVELSEAQLATDMKAVDDGATAFGTTPDLAAGVLATSTADISISDLDYFIPDCCDPMVLGWVIDEERERSEDDVRHELIDAVRTRQASLGPQLSIAREPGTSVH